jgi:hypothetical protein
LIQSLEFRKKIIYSGLLLFACWAIFVRFYKIAAVGLEGDDVFWYWEMARDWAVNKWAITLHYRPVSHLTYSFGMNLFGVNDYSIKIVNSILNLVSGVLIYIAAVETTKNKTISVLSSLVYLSLPFVIEESRSELTHVMSTFYYLISYCCFTQYYKLRQHFESAKKSIYLSLSGFFLGLSAHVHPDLATLGLPFVIFIGTVVFFTIRGKGRFEERFKNDLIKDVLIFSFSYFFVFMIFFVKFGFFTVIKNITHGIGHQQAELNRTLGQKIFHYFHGFDLYLKGSISWLGANLFYFSILSSIYLKIKKEKKSLLKYLPFILICFHLLTCLLIVQRKYIVRLAHPTIPLVLMATFYWIWELLDFHKVKYKEWIVCLLASLVLIISQANIFKPRLYETKIYRQVHNVLKDKVSSENKLLVTPSLFHWYRKGFQSPVYFSNNAVYLSEYYHGVWKFQDSIIENFKKLIDLRKVGYILITKKDKNVRRTLTGHHDAKMFFKSIYGVGPENYSLKWEYDQLKKIVMALNGKLIETNEKFDIFKLGNLERRE